MPSLSLRGFDKTSRARLIEAQLGDDSRQWLVRVEQGRVFFRAKEDKAAPTFALARPFEGERTGLDVWFQAELAAGRVRRFEARVVSLRPGERTLAQFVFDHDDSGEMREWFDFEWTPFSSLSWEVRPQARVWHNDWLMMSLERAVKRAQSALLARPFDKTKAPGIVGNWNGSSPRELEKVVFALSSQPQIRPIVPEQLRPKRGFYAGGFGSSTQFYHRPNSLLGRRQTQWPQWMPSQWCTFLKPFLAPDALEWTRDDHFPESVRAGWRLGVPVVGYSPDSDSDISMHERLEAKLWMREWLQDKTTMEQIEMLLTAPLPQG